MGGIRGILTQGVQRARGNASAGRGMSLDRIHRIYRMGREGPAILRGKMAMAAGFRGGHARNARPATKPRHSKRPAGACRPGLTLANYCVASAQADKCVVCVE